MGTEENLSRWEQLNVEILVTFMQQVKEEVSAKETEEK